MQHHTRIRKVKLNFTRKDQDEDKEFENEVKFYTKMKSKEMSKQKDYNKRLKSCDPAHLFENLLKLVEDKDKNQKMPVRKFYNNTFGTLLNHAFFELQLKKEKNPDENEFFTTEGQIKFLAFFLLDNLPDGEIQ